MQISFHKGYILIISDKLVSLISQLHGFGEKYGTKPAMGFAGFPCFIVLRNLTHPMTKQWINHEKIHIHQYVTTLWISFIISMIEYYYARLILKYTHMQAYIYECTEQEAYLNQANPDYLKTRTPFSVIKYIKHKAIFHSDANYNLIIDKA